jgi:hypothetical protein
MRKPSAKVLLVSAWTLCSLLSACGTAQPREVASGAHTTTAAPRDWRDASYHLTCDGIDSAGFDAKLRNGSAHVIADVSQRPDYLNYDVTLEATATGDLDGDGKPDTVVLLQCMPQPSNAFVQEVQVFRADGSLIGELPSPRTLPETTILSPLYDPTGLTVQDGDVVAAMKEYGPNDSHATGPSVPFTARWHWNGTTFVRVS